MFRVLAVLCILPSVLLAAPDREGKAADPEPVVPLVYGAHVAPVLYHAPNCTTVEETVTLKKCIPKHEKVCEDVEVPVRKVELEEVCNNVTTVVCTPVIPEVKTEEADEETEEAAEEAVEEVADEAAEVVKRAADPQLLPHLHPYAYHPAHVPILYKQDCEEKVEERCGKKPTFKTEKKTVEVCKIVTDVECEDVEETVPRITCTHEEHVVY